MLKKILWLFIIIIIVLVLYFVAWPVPIEPVAWKSPPNPGYTGVFARNERLKGLELLKIGPNHGPEDIALDSQGRIYAGTHEGNIVRVQADRAKPENWVNTKGRPGGIDFDKNGNLIVADVLRGLLAVAPDGKITELAKVADGIPIRFANDVDIAADGKIYFSEASNKFGAKGIGDLSDASLYAVMEHGGHGRLIAYDPATGKARTLLDGLNYANGVAVSHDQTYVLVNEMGAYRVMRYWLSGPKKGKAEPFIEALPGFPDNISTGLNGRFWVALVAPRNPLLDKLSEKPFMRKVIQRMPKFVRPKPIVYGHIIALDGNGKVVEDLQDPNTKYPMNTAVTETQDYLYIGSLVAPALGRLPKAKAGIK